VLGKLSSTSLDKLGQKLHDGRAEALIGRLWPILSLSDRPRYEVFLPPGKVTLRGGSENTYSGWKTLNIKPGQNTINVDIDLPANRIARLIGKRAPEFKNVVAWNTFGPTTMKALRGKVVVLDFWSVYCGPCVDCMPLLMKLHDKYRDKGLEIIAIHNDDVKTWKGLDGHCRTFAKDYWGGRELPFRVAIDNGARTHIPGFPKRFALYGHMTANYGIWRLPTTILIDKQGRVVSTFDVRVDPKQVAKRIERLLRRP
jgi:thiol-disulfide isomerase/thioredoxin